MSFRLLDAFCGAGGCARGYQMAGFHVTGVDIKPQPRYAGDVFVQADALEYVAEHGAEYDAIHASPPCQADTVLNNLRQVAKAGHVRMIEPTRAALLATGRPYVLENVPGAPLHDPVVLCGSQVGLLSLRRHRLFETNWPLLVSPCQHYLYRPQYAPNRGDRRRDPEARASVIVVAGHDSREENGGTAAWRAAMGIGWMTRDELAQAIPPAYTCLIGRQLRTYLEADAQLSLSEVPS